MADPEHIELAREGRDVWNKWRRRNPHVPVNFSRVDFTAPALAHISFAGYLMGPRADFSYCVFGAVDHRSVALQHLSPYAPEVVQFLAGGAWFYGAQFGPDANFTSCSFKGVALFQNAVFGPKACFERAVFHDEANFVDTRFGAGANFRQAAFAKLMQFERARFAGDVSFTGKSLSDGWTPPVPADAIPHLVFRHARFRGFVDFSGRRILDRADFAYAIFNQPPELGHVAGRDRIDFQGTVFRLREGLVPGWTGEAGTVARIRQLRGIARVNNAIDAERDLYVLERKAERGTAWRSAQETPWSEPWRKLSLYGRSLIATALLFLYGLVSDHGRSPVRPALWLAIANAGAYLLYRGHVKPSSTAVGRAARGTWGWIKSQFVSTPPDSPSATTSSLSAEQTRSLFEFWWSNAVPGSVLQSTYEKAVTTLFGRDGLPPLLYVLKFGHTALNVVLVVLLALALRNYFRRAPL
jgi:uncharacterized protein YjbI with pentapeptide repeats